MLREQNLALRLDADRRTRVGGRSNALPRTAAGLALILVLALGTFDGNGQELPPGHYALAFVSKPTSVRVSPDGREILVEFPGALADGEADRVSRSLGPLLEGYSEGYGAVRFRLATPAHASLGEADHRNTVEIVAQDEPVASIDDQRRLQLLQARVLARDGNVADARTRLQRIAAERPNDIEPILTLAETESDAARWQHALGLYDGALHLFPEATDVSRDREALSMRHAPAFHTDAGATFGPSGERAQTATLAADLPLGETWRAGASLQTTHDEIRGLRQSSSNAVANYSGTKLLGGLWVAHDWHSKGDTTRISLFAAPATVGFALKQGLTTPLGPMTVGAYYHQPYWGTVMSFAGNARRDQLGFAQTVLLPSDWQAQFGAGLIRYGLPSNDNVSSGPSALAGLSRGLPERWMPLSGMQTRIGYRLEAEYLSKVTARPTPIGPLPLLDVRKREIHSLYAETSAIIGSGTAVATIGYAIDRFGGSGPQALFRYTSGEDTDRLAFSAEAGLEPSLDLNPRTLIHIGGSVVWRFGGQ